MKWLNDVGEVPQIHLGVGCHLPGRQQNHLGICKYANPFVLSLIGDPGEQIPVQVKNASEMGQEANRQRLCTAPRCKQKD